MLHHVSFAVSDLENSARFYDASLGALGFLRVCEAPGFIGYGLEKNQDKFAIVEKKSGIHIPESGFHLAFSAPSREAVKRFHELALEQFAKLCSQMAPFHFLVGICHGTNGRKTWLKLSQICHRTDFLLEHP